MPYSIVFSPEAESDLNELYDYVARHGGAKRALTYVEELEAACANLADFPERGARRDAT